jgi:hypothetical protein
MRRGWALALMGASLGLTSLLFWLTLRGSLAVLLLASIPFLLWICLKRPDRSRRWSAGVCVLALIIALAPADVRLRRNGRLSVSVRPILWGLPTLDTLERIEPGTVVWGGCVMPVNPGRYAILISW